MGEYAGQPYMPSNGTEGMHFHDKFCMQCIHCNPDPSGKKQCDILCASLCFSIGDADYPKEWVYDENDNPSCTAWKKWNWDEQGDPDNPKNENYVQPEDPAQLKLPWYDQSDHAIIGEGIMSQIKSAEDNFSPSKFPTIEEFTEMMTMIHAKRDGNQRPDSVTSISDTHYEIWVNGCILIVPKEAWDNEMKKYFK